MSAQTHTETSQGSIERLRHSIDTAIGHGFTDGNRVDVLRNGDEIFPAMLDAIGAARHTIDFETFVYWQGDVAWRFGEALAARSRDGVVVRVILDDLGARFMDEDLVDLMCDAGVDVVRFRPVVRWKFWETDHRTHRKILVCDGAVAFSGGVGIAEEWEGDARDDTEWRDTHFRVTGPAVTGIGAAFLSDWRNTGHPITWEEVSTPPGHEGTSIIRVVDGGARIGHSDVTSVLEMLIAAAEERILIQTPYFNPTEDLRSMLIDAVDRGVKVELIVPGPHIDKRMSDVVAVAQYRPLVDAGVTVGRYQPTMLHTKAILVDGVAACVGSANFNRRSIEKDEEVALVILDTGVVAVLEEHFAEDLERSSIEQVGRRSPRWMLARIARWMLHPLRREF